MSERQISLKSSKCHTEEDWAVCGSRSLSPPSNSHSYQSILPSTCVSPTPYLPLPAFQMPCRTARHECRRHGWKQAAWWERCMDWWLTHAHMLLSSKDVEKWWWRCKSSQKPKIRREKICLLTSGLGAVTEPGHVKVTNSWHLLWTTKLQTRESKHLRMNLLCRTKNTSEKINAARKGNNARFISTLTLESLFPNAPVWKRHMD